VNRPSVRYHANPRFLGDDIRLRFGGSGDAALIYDSANDELTLQTANASGDLVDRLAIQAGTDTPAVVFNESGADADFRIEGDTDPNLLYLDAGSDAVVFGGASPDAGEKVKVVGDLRVDGDLDFVGAQEIATTAGNLALNPSSDLILRDGKNFIGDTANANMTVGLTINLGANDNQILTFKSSDVDNQLTAETIETDDFGFIRKASATGGGLRIYGVADADGTTGLSLFGILAADADTTKGTAATAILDMIAYQGDPVTTHGFQNVVADGNIVAMRARVGGSVLARWICDEDGDTWQAGGVGMFGVTPPSQHAKINDPVGGATQDAEARTAINAIIDVLEGLGAAASP